MSNEPSNIVPANRNPGAFLCERYQARIEEALGYTAVRQPKMPLTVETFSSAVANDLLRDRTTGSGNLWEGFQTSPEAALAAMLQAAQMKLMPGTAYKLFWLIPFKDKGRPSVRGEIGYKGYSELSQRHPRVHSIQSILVYKGEKFSFNAGTGQCDHEVDMAIDRSPENVVLGYLRAVITEEATHHAVLDQPLIIPMSIDEILKRRECSQSWKRSGKASIWGQWPIEMMRKTVMKHGLSHGEIPQDMGLASAISADGAEDALPDGGDPVPTIPDRPTRSQTMRERLGISETPPGEIVDLGLFALASEAILAATEAGTAEQLDSIYERTRQFGAKDRDAIDVAISARHEELGRAGRL